MQKLVITLLFVTFYTSVTAQNFSINHGAEFKLDRNKSIPALVGIDESGIYMANYRIKSKYLTSDYSDKIYSLIKYDFKYNQVFDHEYKDGLEKSEVSEMLLLRSNLFLFSYAFDRKEKSLRIYGTTLDKANGKMNEALSELSTSSTSTGESLQSIRFSPNADSTRIVITAIFAEKESQRILQVVCGLNLKAIQSANVLINQPSKFRSLSQIGQTQAGLTLVNIKNYEEQEVGKRRKKNVFTDFSVEAYDHKGAKSYTVSPVRPNIYVVSQKLYVGGAEFFLLALYDTDKARKSVKGVVIERYDASNGKLISSSHQPLSAQLIATINKKDTEDKKSKAEDEEDGISTNLRIRSFEFNPVTQKAYVFAELFLIESATYTERTIASGTMAGSSREYSKVKFTTSDVLLIEMDNQYTIQYMTSLPKKQLQYFDLVGSVKADDSWEEFGNYFAGMSLDFYSSFAVFPYKDKMILLFNDDPANGRVVKPDAPIKELNNLRSCSSYALIYDPASRVFTRKLLFNNSSQPIPLMKLATMVGNDIFLYAREPHAIRKSDFKIIKVSIK
jgi:hypothetical protein